MLTGIIGNFFVGKAFGQEGHYVTYSLDGSPLHFGNESQTATYIKIEKSEAKKRWLDRVNNFRAPK